VRDIIAGIFMIIVTFGLLHLGEMFGRSDRNKSIKSGESIILDNSSYKCKLTNTLEQK